MPCPDELPMSRRGRRSNGFRRLNRPLMYYDAFYPFISYPEAQVHPSGCQFLPFCRRCRRTTRYARLSMIFDRSDSTVSAGSLRGFVCTLFSSIDTSPLD